MKKITSLLMMFMLFVGMGWAQEILDGHFYKLVGNGGGGVEKSVVTKELHFVNNGEPEIFFFEASGNGFIIQGASSGLYTKSSKSNGSWLYFDRVKNNASVWVVSKNNTARPDYFSVTLADGNMGWNTFGNVNGNNVKMWTTGNNENGSSWQIEEVSFTKDEALALIDNCNHYYYTSKSTEAINAAKTAINKEGVTPAEIQQALSTFYKTENVLNAENAPKAGDYIKVLSDKNKKFVHANSNKTLNAQEKDLPADIFALYANNDGFRIYSWQQGLSVAGNVGGNVALNLDNAGAKYYIFHNTAHQDYRALIGKSQNLDDGNFWNQNNEANVFKWHGKDDPASYWYIIRANVVLTVQGGDISYNGKTYVSGSKISFSKVPTLGDFSVVRSENVNAIASTVDFVGSNICVVSVEANKSYRLKNRAYGRYMYIKQNNDGNQIYTTSAKNNSDASLIWRLEPAEGQEGKYYLKTQGVGSKAILTSSALYAEKFVGQGEAAAGVVVAKDGGFSWGTPDNGDLTSKKFLHDPNWNANGCSIVGWEIGNGAVASHWNFEAAESIEFTVGTGGWSSMCFDFPVVLPADMTAYKVNTQITPSESALYLEALEKNAESGTSLPAGTPVFVTGVAGTKYTLSIVDSNKSEKIVTGLQGILMNETPSVVNRSVYGIATRGEGDQAKTALYKFSGNGKFPANRAYFAVESQAAPQMMGVFIDGDNITGVEESVMDSDISEVYYDLNGRRVLYPTRGIYVTKSGHKVFIK